jgi:hypothetical protein
VYNDGTKARPICADPVEWVDGGSGDEVCRYRVGAVRKSDLDAKDKQIADLTAENKRLREALDACDKLLYMICDSTPPTTGLRSEAFGDIQQAAMMIYNNVKQALTGQQEDQEPTEPSEGE